LKKQLQTATELLKENDPVLRPIIEAIGKCTISKRKDYYIALVNSIIAQQISVKAAQSIRNKFLNLIEGDLQPEKVRKYSLEELRTAGLSIQKATYIRDLSEKYALNKNVYRHLGRYSDDEVIEKLTEVKGIGVWTAQMFLMFSLGRLDVLPVDDVGFQNAVIKYYRLRKKPTKKQLRQIAKKWIPYRSVAVWYLWKAVDKQP